MPYELFIAIRYLRGKRRDFMISVITLVAIAAVAAGVAALIVVLGMMTGFREEFQTRILSGTAHLNLYRKDGHTIEDYNSVKEQTLAVPHVRTASATVYHQVVIQGKTETGAALIKGVDLNAPAEASEVFQFTKVGDAAALGEADVDPETGAEIDRMVIGRELAKSIGVEVGDVATVISPRGHLSPLGIAPRLRDYKIAGFFESGLAEYDSTWAYISLDAAERLAGEHPAAEIIQIKVDDVDEVKAIGRDLLRALGDEYAVQDWQDLNAPIFTALSYEKLLSAIALLVVIGIASLNIITVLILIVIEKRRDVAVLKSMGATARSIMCTFVFQGVLIGMSGMVLGLAAGLTFCHFANSRQMIKLPPGSYALSYLPFHVRLADIALVLLATGFISLISTLYPSWNAARFQPVEVLRYE